MSERILRQENDQKVIWSLLNAAKTESTNAFVWKLLNDQKITVSLKFIHVSKVGNEIIFKCSEENIDSFRSLIGDERLINVFLPGSNLIFQAELKSFSNEGSLVLFFPKMLGLPERRKNIRLEKNDRLKMKVKFYVGSTGLQKNLVLFEKDLFDVSAGGLSFIITSLEGKYFSKNMEIPGMHLQFENLDLLVEGKIVNFIPIEPNAKNGLIYRGQKVCIQFTRMAQSDKEKINLKVFNFLNLNAA